MSGVRHWLENSGASHQIAGEGTRLTNSGSRAPGNVDLADGGKRVATKMGSAVIDGMAAGNLWVLKLNDGFVVAGMAVSLLSVRVATNLGYRDTLDEEEFSTHGRDKFILNGRRQSIVYVLSEAGAHSSMEAMPSTTYAWHQRCAHAEGGTLNHVPASETGVDVTVKELRNLWTATCGPCVRGKMTRAPDSTQLM